MITALLTAGAAAGPQGPAGPVAPTGGAGFTVAVNGIDGTPSTSIVLILAITLLSVAPAMLLMMTAFTKIVVVLSITRNALGLQGVPPNQVLAGLALFLSLFVMAPVITQINTDAVQPFLQGTITQGQMFEAAAEPLKQFMLHQTRQQDLALITRAADRPNPANPADVPLTTLIPAFVLSELRAAFIIGFVIYVPFLVIDIVVSSGLMALGMMMLPPVTVSLPFKLLLFVMVNGWGLIVTALVGSYR
ncbi:flagellar type III secretion system pore protein FliP [Streptomyces sp. NP160]|uniref:flagellar type III secretion system pore protein FliP n=1 Tax=Streptomyces sp. NP160 TaxID=2586637 RepID=UPI00111AA99F|nr:flagellar type III secretion system pore protein FliP [Streptomyces sp. NP160]TNM69402.1 flagellar type III secretion system pore protein FliP [Streptomyces sp. NP160]